MSFVRARSNSAPAVLTAYFQWQAQKQPERAGGADGAGGAPYIASHAAADNRPRLMINGAALDFSPIIDNGGRSVHDKAADARVLIENTLRAAGVGTALAPVLSRLLCDPDFVGADGAALNSALDGVASFGQPARRELNVMVDRDGASVHRCSTWSECQVNRTPEVVDLRASDLMCVDSGVRFYVDKDRKGNANIVSRPDYWVHAVSNEPAAKVIAGTLGNRPDGATTWDRFVDVLAWIVGAVGIRFESAENLGKAQAELMRHGRGQETLYPEDTLDRSANRVVAVDSGAGIATHHRPGLPVLATSATLENRLEDVYRQQDDAKKSLSRRLRLSSTIKESVLGLMDASADFARDAEAQRHSTIHSALVDMPVQLLKRVGRTSEAKILQSVKQAPAGDGAFAPLLGDSVVGLVMGIVQDCAFGAGLGGADQDSLDDAAVATFIRHCSQAASSPGQDLKKLRQRVTRAAEAAELVARQSQEIGEGVGGKYIANAPHALAMAARIARAALASDVFAKVKGPATKPANETMDSRMALLSSPSSQMLSQIDNAALLLLCGLPYPAIESYVRAK